MKPCNLKIFALSVAVAAGVLAPAAKAATYEIDPVHSHIAFFIDHLGFSKQIGVFNEFSGTFDFDSADVAASTLEASVKVSSIFTNSEQRDSDLQGADWFNTTEFPDMTFKGVAFEKTGEKTGTITGELTVAGVTNSVTLDVTFNGEGDNPWSGIHQAGFSAKANIKRSDFGIKTALPMIGDDVEIFIEIEGLPKS